MKLQIVNLAAKLCVTNKKQVGFNEPTSVCWLLARLFIDSPSIPVCAEPCKI